MRRRYEGWHADDCGGCDGCGYITWRLRWLPGPCPWWARPFQTNEQTRRRNHVALAILTPDHPVVRLLVEARDEIARLRAGSVPGLW